jgi:signal transduction histidine kinase
MGKKSASALALEEISKENLRLQEIITKQHIEIKKKNRELEIEASLEKIRSRSLGMHKSDELRDVVVVVFEILKKFGLKFDVAGLQLFTDGSRDIIQWVAAPGLVSVPVLAKLPYFEKDFSESKIIRDVWAAKEMGKSFHNYSYSFEEKNRFFQYAARHNDLEAIPSDVREFQMQAPGYTQTLIAEKHSALWVDSYIGQTISEDEFNILERCARVFDQAYTRFLDLQKAEAQAREAQIESALERVRARTMGMQKSEDLREVVKMLYVQLQELDFKWGVASIIIMDSNTGNLDWWMEGFSDGYDLPEKYHVPYFDHRGHQEQLDHWKKGSAFAVVEVSGEEKKTFDQYYFSHTDFIKAPENSKNLMMSSTSVLFSMAFMKYGALSWSPTPVTEEQSKILQRFAKVFEQSYTRFIDLQKAEAQAREAQIEAALERIRSRSLAMHHSEELREVIAIFFEKLRELEILLGTVAIQLFDDLGMPSVFWVGNEIQDPQMVISPYDDKIKLEDNYLGDGWKAMSEQKEILNKIYSKEQKDRFFEYLFANNDLTQIPENAREVIRNMDIHVICLFPNKNSGLFVDSWDGKLYTEDDFQILKRASKVFEQAYIRFLDLQKAEAQAKEAKIEAALERVRSRAMVMQTSLELKYVAYELRKQIGILGLKDLDTCVIHLYEESPDLVHSWAAIKPPESKDEIHEFQETVPKKGLSIIEEALEAYKSDRQDYILVNEGSKMIQWLTFLKKISPEAYNLIFESGKTVELEKLRSYWSCADFPGGSLLMITTSPPEETFRSILRRFASVFGLAYRRFADLKHAEAQAREALIEAALERVRSRAMAMHKSSEIPEVAHTMYFQMKQLGFEYGATTIIIIDNEAGDMDWWMAGFEEGKFPQAYRIGYFDHPVQKQILKDWNSGKELSVIPLGGKSKKNYDEELFTRNGFKVLPDRVKDWMQQRESVDFTIVYMKHGALHWGPDLLSEEQESILKRFAKVFEQTYTRFLDLKNAEEQAKEATKQASLDRVRAEIASMRSASDLDLITPLIFNELTILGVPFIRCGVFVIYEKDEIVEAYLSSPDGKSLGVLRLSYHSSELTSQTVDAWRKGLVYRQHWGKDDFVQWIELMMEQDQIQDKKTYQGEAAPPENLDLHFVPFSHGMLYVGSTHSLNDTEIDLVKGLAKAFSIAYARYEDFVRLEKAKESIETALMELKSTQAQLIQSEKMASLGELTAGIAHEIQNPLNFVNNFSEVSAELVDEIRESRSERREARIKNQESRNKKQEGEQDESEVLEDEILEDIKKNLEKIQHHGKRADAIVKGMLQHSRTSTGEKVRTDINALSDEYLRLSYHGMRAKDKSFNAEFHTDFDLTLPKVNLIPQDIGRVLLNIINNAFQACAEQPSKGSEPLEGFKPLVTVSSKNLGDKIEISISDNGPGIPDAIKNKIFQPFFTTKPTGQGTGLGLSLSYDIVKAHGGNLEFETTNHGTNFVIILPL